MPFVMLCTMRFDFHKFEREYERVTGRRFSFNRGAALAAGVLGLASAAAVADTVVLANGDRLTGQVLLLDSGTLVLKTEYAGELHIKWDQAASVKVVGT